MVAYRVRYKGAEIDVDTHEELVRLLREIGIHPLGGDAVIGLNKPRARSTVTQLEGFLDAIYQVREGASSKIVAAAAELRSPRALSGALRTWRKILSHHGLEMEDVVHRERRGNGYVWLPGPKLEDALLAIRATVSGRDPRPNAK